VHYIHIKVSGLEDCVDAWYLTIVAGYWVIAELPLIGLPGWVKLQYIYLLCCFSDYYQIIKCGCCSCLGFLDD